MKASGVVHAAISEETPEKTVLNDDGSYIVTFDPIDGSSVIDSNFSIGSVFGIWNTTDVIGK
jgi:fructose-1,6-bisphosphatase I